MSFASRQFNSNHGCHSSRIHPILNLFSKALQIIHHFASFPRSFLTWLKRKKILHAVVRGDKTGGVEMYSSILTPWPCYRDCSAFPWKQDLSMSEHALYDGENREKKIIQWPPDPLLISNVLKLLLSSARTTDTFTSEVRKT